MLHQTDRNIVRANTIGRLTDIAFGPSDDDFHYTQHHGTINHAETPLDSNEARIGVKLIFQGGACEIQWATGEGYDSEHSLDAIANVGKDGTLSFPFWSVDEAGNQRAPFWVEFDRTGLKVYHHEGDCDGNPEFLVFDSNTISGD